MKNILDAPFIREMKETTANMYRLGWDERNGGNISYLLDSDEVYEYLDANNVLRTIPLGFDAKSMAGKIFVGIFTKTNEDLIFIGQRWGVFLSHGMSHGSNTKT